MSSQPATPSSDRKHLYEADSPDELALVDASCLYSIRLFQRSVHHVVSMPGSKLIFCLLNSTDFNIYLVVLGEGTVEYEVLQVLPFDSVRKRMSVVLRRPETRQIVVYCKGADSAILPRLAYTRNHIV
jgi:phospholipid-translocating ATPase